MDIERIYRQESGRILATLIRLLGDFDLAEEVMQEAFATAVERWPKQGVPGNPSAWLISTGRHKAIDLLRRRALLDSKIPELQRKAETDQQSTDGDMQNTSGDDQFGDDRLRLIFTCCHPALALEAQVALTLRTLCGLSTDEIARGFLVPSSTMGHRLVRAKKKIREARIPYQVPPESEIGSRLEAVLLVIYLVFNGGYCASSGDVPIRRELCTEAIRLGRVVCQSLPRQREARACLH
jgi:RNA polymerase sigma-70 factor (ECF subfamily)